MSRKSINRNNEWKKKEVESVEPVQMNIYQSNTYSKDLGWLQLNGEPRIQERQEVNPSILKDNFSSRADTSIFTSIAPVLLDQSKDTS